MAIDPDIIEIELVFTKQRKARDISLYQRMAEWLAEPNYVTYDNLLEKLELEGESQVTQLEFPITLQDAQRLTELLYTLLKKSELFPAEMLVLSCVHHPQLGLSLNNCLKKLIRDCKVTLEIPELNAQKAAEYIKFSADKGFVPALYQIGVDFYYGFCVPEKNIATAIDYWKLAELAGFPFAAYRLGYVYENDVKNIDQAVSHYINGMKLKHANSCFALGRLQQDKLIGNILNLPSVIDCYKAAARQGNIKALFAIINYYQVRMNETNSLIANVYYDIYLKQADINQVLMLHKIEIFLSQLTFSENDELKIETLPRIKNICNGFVLMMFRAALIGESEIFLNRLRSLSIKSDEEIKQMGQLYNQYRTELHKVSDKSLHHLHQRLKQCNDNNQNNRTRKTHYLQIEQQLFSNLFNEQTALLLYAKELYVFISSLLFVIKIINYSIKQNDKTLDCNDFIEIINIIPPDQLVQKEQSGLTDIVITPIMTASTANQIFIFSFNFLEHELIDALNKVIFPGDYLIIRSTDHVVYVKRHLDEFHFYDPALGFEKYISTRDLVIKLKTSFFTSKNRDDINILLNLRIYACDLIPIVRPSTKQLLEHIFSQRGRNLNINALSWDGNTALYHAACHNDIEMVKELLERSADCNIINKKGLTAAHIAIIFDHAEVLDLLAQSQANLNFVSTDGNNMVHLAVQSHCHAVIKILAKYGVNLNKPNATNVTPICLALKQKKLNIVIEILHNMKSIDILAKQDIGILFSMRDKLLLVFFAVINDMKNDNDKLKFIDEVLETEKVKQNALGQFFQTPSSIITFFFSTKDKTGSIIKIVEYRGRLLAKIKDKQIAANDNTTNSVSVRKLN